MPTGDPTAADATTFSDVVYAFKSISDAKAALKSQSLSVRYTPDHYFEIEKVVVTKVVSIDRQVVHSPASPLIQLAASAG